MLEKSNLLMKWLGSIALTMNEIKDITLCNQISNEVTCSVKNINLH